MYKFEYPETEIAAYDANAKSLFEHHLGKFVVIKGEKLFGAFDTFDAAARAAIKAYGRGPYLIREVKEPAVMPMPSSARFGRMHAAH